MSQCRKITFQITKVKRTLAKHLRTKDYLKIAPWNRQVYISDTFTMNKQQYLKLV